MHGRACTILPCSPSKACSLLQIALPVGMSGIMSHATAQLLQGTISRMSQALVQHCGGCLHMPTRLLGGSIPTSAKPANLYAVMDTLLCMNLYCLT